MTKKDVDISDKISAKNNKKFRDSLEMFLGSELSNPSEKLSKKGKMTIKKIDGLTDYFTSILLKKKLIKKDEVESMKTEISNYLKVEDEGIVKLLNSGALSIITSLASPLILKAGLEFMKKKKESAE